MRRILITGKNSYIGNSFKEWLAQWPEKYEVDEVETRDGIWREKSFEGYDSVLHVAGIAHNSSDPKLEDLYYQVNRDLTYEIAKKAKQEGVEHFVFMSSMIVYGTKNEVITKDTEPNPDNFYGDSKLQAEKRLSTLEDDAFKVAVIRPPMVYGKGSKGNYPKLAKLAQIIPIFPDYENKRSMIYINNLTEFLRLVIEYKDAGYFHPQNQEYVKTSEMVSTISQIHDKKIWVTKLFNPIISTLLNISLINKVFGDLYYEKEVSDDFNKKYQIIDFKDSIRVTEDRRS